MSKIIKVVDVFLFLICFVLTITCCDSNAGEKPDMSKEKSSSSKLIPGGTNWPDWVPSIVPEYKYGRVQMSVDMSDEGGGALTLVRIQKDQDPYASYKKDLLDKGWEVIDESELGHTKHLNMKHGDYMLLYTFSTGGGGVSIHFGKSE